MEIHQTITWLRSKRDHIAFVFCFLLAWLITFPAPLMLAAVGEGSWVLALHIAVAKGLVFGKDIVWTYGPLGYLLFPLYVSYPLWVASVIFGVVVHTAFYATLAIFAWRNDKLLNGLVLAFSGTLIENFFFGEYVIPALLLLCLILLIEHKRYCFVAPLSAIAAITVYVKTDIGLLSFATLLLALGWIASKHKYRIVVISLAAYAASFVSVGYFLIRSDEAFSLFLIGSSQVTLGYSSAMSIDGPFWQLAIAAVALVSLIVYSLLQVKSKKLSPILFVSLGFFFITFKEGFVRQDLHVLIFFGGWALFFVLSFVSSGRFTRKNRLKLFLLLMTLMLLVSGVRSPQMGRLGYLRIVYSPAHLTNPFLTAYLLSNPHLAEQEFSDSVNALKLEYGLSSETIRMISNHTVDVFQKDVSLAYSNGLQWDPRPVFQSYQAYTPFLDELNALHFNSSLAPDYVLYAMGSIDNRYPIFDEPATFRALLCNYDFIGADGPFVILQRVGYHCDVPVSISEATAKFGQTIVTPPSDDYLFVRISVDYNLLGKLENFVYKGPLVLIRLGYENGTYGIFRFIWENAEDGLFLGGTPTSLYEGRNQSIRTVSLLTNSSDAFQTPFTLSFFAMHSSRNTQNPYSEQTSNPPPNTVEWHVNHQFDLTAYDSRDYRVRWDSDRIFN